MTPLRDVTLFDRRGTVEALVETAHRAGFRPVPVNEGSGSNIVGVASLSPWDLMGEDLPAEAVDEFGSAIGLLTVRDILEMVVGEVDLGYRYARHSHTTRRSFEALDEGVYLLDARLPISEVNDGLGLNLPTESYRTIGGMFLANLRHIPRQGESLADSGYRFTVEEATEKTVVRVRAEPEV